MRNINFILATVLIAGTSFAQQKSESVNGILSELKNYQAPATEDAIVTAATTEQADVTTAAADTVAQTEAPAAIETESIDVNAKMSESRDAYAGGEFERAQAGFEAIIKQEPENLVARMYLRKILERNFRTVELSSIETVNAAWDNSLVLRSYAFPSDSIEKMELEETTTALDVTAKFPEVDFPEGASAVYQPRLEKLFVRNTRENLLVIEEILMAMDIANMDADTEQVEIEAKFVEIAEGTLEELGFEWQMLADRNLAGDVTIPGGQYLFDDALRGGPSNPNLPFSVPDTLGAGSTAASGAWSAYRFEDTFNAQADYLTTSWGDKLDVVISALDQSSGSDVLSAPRVVTKSGEEAVIRVGEKHFYPEVYEPNASGGNIVHVRYEDWEEKLLGVELSVTPQVDGDQIEMELNPKIYELLGWQNYEVAPANSSYTWYQYRVGIRFNHDPVVAKLPIFTKREIETEVTIADGATIVMGGLINEKTESFEDKVPVLGNLPFVGRMFRNEGERSIKRNLVMFVTAKKVDPTGRISSSRSFE